MTSRWSPLTQRWQNSPVYNPFIVVVCKLRKAAGEEIEICKAAKGKMRENSQPKGGERDGRVMMVSQAEYVDELQSFCGQKECISLFNYSGAFLQTNTLLDAVEDIWWLKGFSSCSTGNTLQLCMNGPEK